MAEFLNNDIQIIAPGADAIFEQNIGCNRGNILFRPQTSQISLRGNVNNPCARFARYEATFNGNIAIPEGGTAGAIAISLTVGGSPIPTSKAIVTPTVADAYFNVTSTAIIDVPIGCCPSVSVRNVSESATPDTTPAPTINMQNANLVINRIA